MSIEQSKLKNIIEAAMMAVAKPMSIEQLMQLFAEDERPSNTAIKEALTNLVEESKDRGVELKEVASGYRYQAKQEYSEWLSRLWEEKPAKYSRAALETLALIAYRQPVTRAEIEDVRGVGVSSSIIKTMIEREWIRVVGHRDVPGRPALYATTKQFLDYFNMKSLDELPSLAEIKDLEDLNPELDLPNPDEERIHDKATENSTEQATTKEDGANELAENSEANTQQSAENDEDESQPGHPVNQSLDEQDLVSGITPEDLDSDGHLQTDVFDELDDVHTESNTDSFYADQQSHNDDQSVEQEPTESDLSDDELDSNKALSSEAQVIDPESIDSDDEQQPEPKQPTDN
jgi:segregation and condensation protein B